MADRLISQPESSPAGGADLTNPIQSPSLQEIQRRQGIGAAEAMRRQDKRLPATGIDGRPLRIERTMTTTPHEPELIELRERIVELEAVVRYWKSSVKKITDDKRRLLQALQLAESVYRLNAVGDGEPSSVLDCMQAAIREAQR